MGAGSLPVLDCGYSLVGIAVWMRNGMIIATFGEIDCFFFPVSVVEGLFCCC